MADIVRDQQTTLPVTMLTRYRDMGDGTHAEVISVPGPFNVTVTGGTIIVQGVAGGTPVNVADGGNALTVDGNTGILGYRSSDGTYQPLRLDRATNTLQIIDYSHHEIHAGSHFFVTDYQTIGAATAQFRAGATERQESEIILKQNTKYILRVTSGTAGNICAVKLRWYEHTNL